MKLTTKEWTRKVYKYLEDHTLFLLNQLEISTGIEKGLKSFVRRYDDDYYDSEMLTKEEYYNVFERFLYEKYSDMVYNENYFKYIVSCVHDYEKTLALMKEVLEKCYPTKEIDYLIGSNETEYILNKLEEDKDFAFKLADDYNVVTSEAGVEALLYQLETMIEERYKLIKKFGLKNYQEYNQLAEENNWDVTLDELTYVVFIESEDSVKVVDFFNAVSMETTPLALGIETVVTTNIGPIDKNF